MLVRLQKLLASAGIGSRRDCEIIISTGRVRVNGNIVSQLGASADPETDRVEVDGKLIDTKKDLVYILMNKPTGYVTTVEDRHADHTVMELLKGVNKRVYPVGRLDEDTAGVLLFTNDGDFTLKLTHPKYGAPKTYRALVRGDVHDQELDPLRQGVEIDGEMSAPAEFTRVEFQPEHNITVIDIVLHEGKNRQIRKMFQTLGYQVSALTRISIGPITMSGLAPGGWRKLRGFEVDALLKLAGEAKPRPSTTNPRSTTTDVRPVRRAPDHRATSTSQPVSDRRSKPQSSRPWEGNSSLSSGSGRPGQSRSWEGNSPNSGNRSRPTSPRPWEGNSGGAGNSGRPQSSRPSDGNATGSGRNSRPESSRPTGSRPSSDRPAASRPWEGSNSAPAGTRRPPANRPWGASGSAPEQGRPSSPRPRPTGTGGNDNHRPQSSRPPSANWTPRPSSGQDRPRPARPVDAEGKTGSEQPRRTSGPRKPRPRTDPK